MTDPSHHHRPVQTMDARHPRALFPVLAAPDSRPTIGILALQGDVREHSLALEAAGARPVVVRRAADLGEAPGHRLDGLVIPGGESTTMSTLLVAFGMLEPLRELISAGLPASNWENKVSRLVTGSNWAVGVAGELGYRASKSSCCSTLK